MCPVLAVQRRERCYFWRHQLQAHPRLRRRQILLHSPRAGAGESVCKFSVCVQADLVSNEHNTPFKAKVHRFSNLKIIDRCSYKPWNRFILLVLFLLFMLVIKMSWGWGGWIMNQSNQIYLVHLFNWCLPSDLALQTQETREILHFHYTTWPDFGVPDSPASFLNFLFKVRESGCLDSDEGPVVVHCSAGIGRSGTFCLVDTCLLLVCTELCCKQIITLCLFIPSLFILSR